jgi:hypothetical protein
VIDLAGQQHEVETRLPEQFLVDRGDQCRVVVVPQRRVGKREQRAPDLAARPLSQDEFDRAVVGATVGRLAGVGVQHLELAAVGVEHRRQLGRRCVVPEAVPGVDPSRGVGQESVDASVQRVRRRIAARALTDRRPKCVVVVGVDAVFGPNLGHREPESLENSHVLGQVVDCLYCHRSIVS